MNRWNSLFLLPVLFVLFIVSCTSNEIGNIKDVKSESIYFDYRVWGDEETGNMTVKLQYRFAGPNGTTLFLDDVAKAEFDGVAIKADSSKMNGVYYEISKPVNDFTGKHTIVFTDPDKKEYKEEFSFQPLSLITHVPKTVDRGDLVFEFDGLAPEDYVRILATDTAAFSEEINRVDTVKNGRIIITKSELERLSNGPVHFEFSREDEKRVKNGTREGGRLAISYSLKREFELRDNP